MQKWFLTVAAAVLALTLISCAQKCPEPSAIQAFGDTSRATDLALDASIPEDQRASIQKDLERLSSVSLPTADKDDKCVLGVTDTSAVTLSQWLKTRIRLIVGESFDYKSNQSSTQAGSGNPSIFRSDVGQGDDEGTSDASFDQANGLRESVSEIVTVMFNLGAYLYLQGRRSSSIYAVTISDQNYRVTTPRVGLVQIGKGMFTANRVKSSAQDSEANSLLRLAVIFHEARHSDGNGDNAAFPHAKCTSGDYSGTHACENNKNGPYAVQAHLVKRFERSCVECTSTEREAMLRLMADYQSRILPDAEYRDDHAEGYQ